MPDPDLVEVAEGLAEKATKGPWEWDEVWSVLRGSNEESILWPANSIGEPQNATEGLGACGHHAEAAAEDNAAFIAWCREGVPALCAELRHLRAEVERLKATLSSRSVKLMGPSSPFWRCEYCQAMQTSPVAFPHKPECILAAHRSPVKEGNDVEE